MSGSRSDDVGLAGSGRPPSGEDVRPGGRLSHCACGHVPCARWPGHRGGGRRRCAGAGSRAGLGSAPAHPWSSTSGAGRPYAGLSGRRRSGRPGSCARPVTAHPTAEPPCEDQQRSCVHDHGGRDGAGSGGEQPQPSTGAASGTSRSVAAQVETAGRRWCRAGRPRRGRLITPPLAPGLWARGPVAQTGRGLGDRR